MDFQGREMDMKAKTAACMSILFICSLSFAAVPETFHLDKNQKWQPVGNDETSRYLLEISKLKQLIGIGDTAGAQQQLAKIKREFALTGGSELDAFMKADLLYSEGKFTESIPEFNKFMDEHPTSPLYDAAQERVFQMGTALLAGYKVPLLKIFKVKGYDEGIKTMEKLADRAGDSAIAQQALIAVARHYEGLKKFRQAYDTWAYISSRWPTGDLGKMALLQMARNMESSYKGPKYDASSLLAARDYYMSYRMRYPDSAAELGIDDILVKIEEQVAYKQLSIGKYYSRTGSKTASSLYYKHVADGWPETVAGEAAKTQIK
jgi:outer membrane protein assembly factor BamD (BamD/ComL family)